MSDRSGYLADLFYSKSFLIWGMYGNSSCDFNNRAGLDLGIDGLREVDMDLLELCEDCKHACFISEDPGFSPRECGLPSREITYLDGCKKDLEPHYDEEQEAIECEGYESKPCEW